MEMEDIPEIPQLDIGCVFLGFECDRKSLFVVLYQPNAYSLHCFYICSILLSKEITMADTTNFSLRLDNDLKKQSEVLFSELGMNLTTAINVFLRQSIREGGFPFKIKLETPNKQTIAAMEEALALIADGNTRKYSVEEALQELKK